MIKIKNNFWRFSMSKIVKETVSGAAGAAGAASSAGVG